MSRNLTLLLAAWVLFWTLGIASDSFAVAQPPADSETSSPESATEGASVTVAPAGTGRHVSGRWATVAVNGLNRTGVDAEETVAVMVGDETNLQYARRLWVPARSTRQSWLSIQIPGDLYQDQTQISMSSIHLKESGRGEEFQANEVGMPTSTRSLLLSWEQSRTAVLADPFDFSEFSKDVHDAILTTVYAGRDSIAAGEQDLGVVHLSSDFLPPAAECLDPLDQIVIANDRMLNDTVAVSRLRTWLHGGGRVWVMIDQVEPDSVAALLGDGVCYSVVDRVELNEFEIVRTDTYSMAQNVEAEKWSSETPVELVRVIADTDDVSSRIDGWPAAFWKRVGYGEILFTALGPRGWVRDQTESPTVAMTTMSSRFFINRIEEPRHAKEIESFLEEEIGYRIPTRSSVAGVLGLHMLVILGVGAWLARRRSLHHLAVVIPVAALAAAGSLLALGNQQTSAVPSTIAVGQIARAAAESSELQVQSIAAIYSQESRKLHIHSSPETTTVVRDSESTGEMKRLLWDDSGESEWMFITQPPGVVRHVESESIVSVPEPWNFRGRFTESGFRGRITGLDAKRCQDGVIVSTAAPALAVAFDATSADAVSGFDDVLAPNQFIDDKLMSDVQQDRQTLMRQLMSADRPMIDRRPTLLVWTDPINSGVTFDAGFVRRGATLASIPVQFERLPSGMNFQVPASFVRLELHAGTRGTSSVFNVETGRWLEEMNKPNETDLRCVTPSVLLPCQLSRATVLIKINAPSRTLELKGYVDGKFVTLHRKENPTGLLRFEIDQPEALQLDADGGLLLSIAISQTEEERQAASQEKEDPDAPRGPSRSTWQIDYVHVNLEGTSL